MQGCARKCVATCIRGGGVFRLLGLCLLTLAWGMTCESYRLAYYGEAASAPCFFAFH